VLKSVVVALLFAAGCAVGGLRANGALSVVCWVGCALALLYVVSLAWMVGVYELWVWLLRDFWE
jgi:hypothetical protein